MLDSTINAYEAFLATKQRPVINHGPAVEADQINPMLHDWQAEIVKWAVRRGRCALFEDCGLGKTAQQIEWARLVAKRSLILAPLSVARQTVREGTKFGLEVNYVRDQAQVDGDGVWITNYEMLDRFDASAFDAVVADESSILKAVDGKTRKMITDTFARTPYRLACTATPAPNDVSELCNHAEFLGHMPRNEMLAAYFVHDEIGWRPKGHASVPMYKWMAGWACALRRPSDIGFPDDGYDLPGLEVIPEVVDASIDSPGQLFATELGGVGGRAKARRATMSARLDRTAELASGNNDQWIIWCGLNDEAQAVTRLVDGAINVEGSWSPDAKADALEAFQDGSIRVLVTKTSIAGFGMNFQNCANQIFLGIGDSYEQYYQAIRRSYRFGQTRTVRAHIVVSPIEQQIVQNIQRKEQTHLHSADLLTRFNPIRKTQTNDNTITDAPRTPRRMLASTTMR